MKFRFFIPLIVAVLFTMSGCSFEFKSIETLMRPPLTATERELEKSIDSIIGNNISLRSPASGTYHSAITLHDLDGDHNEEAIIFYVNNNDTAVVRMCVLKMNTTGWQMVSDFAGNGSGVYSVDFYDLNNDGSDDMLVSWYLFENKISKNLTVYSSIRNGNEVNFSSCAAEKYNFLCVADVFSTGEKQIVLTYTDTAKKNDKTTIRLMELNSDNRVVLLGETSLDDRISSITSLKFDNPKNSDSPRFFVDALLQDNKLITEILVWDKEIKSFNPIISSSNQYNRLITMRSSNLYSYDIDSDGIIEIPKREPLNLNKKLDNNSGYMLVWYNYINGVFAKERSYIVNIRDNYRLYVPDKLEDKISVSIENESVWSFYDDKSEKLFTVTVLNENGWNGKLADNSSVLLSNSEKVFVCTAEEKLSYYSVSLTDLEKYFSLNS